MAIIIPIGVDTSGLRKLNTAGAKLRAFGKVAAIAAGAAAFGGLVKTLQVGTEEFMEQQKVAAQTGAVLKSTGGIANVTAGQMEKLSRALMEKSGVDDEAITSGQNLLLTFTKIRNETGRGNDIFDQATVAMLDLSVAMGKDLNSSAILVGKALNDPVKGASALSRAGVQLTQAQKDQIAAFVESGRVLEAQKIILAELTTQFGGSAEAAGKTLPGQLNILKQTFRNLAGELAASFLPSVARAATALINFLGEFARAPTLKAKVELITGSISEAFGRIRSWWTTGDRKELPARVILTPPGREQVRQLFVALERQSRAISEAAGRRIGQALARGILDGTSGGLDPSFFGLMKRLFLPYRFFQLGRDIATGIVTGFREEMDRQGASFIDVVRNLILRIPGISLGRELGDQIAEGIKAQLRRGSVIVSNELTQTVKDAIQSARQSLAGAGGTLAGLVGEIIGGTSPEAKRLAEIRKQQKQEAAARQEALLRANIAAAESDDERARAEQDLSDFLLEQEATRLEDSIQQQQDAANTNIANLVESFNSGLISADQFSAELNNLIGANRGEELGAAFTGAFDRELQTILNTARDIFSIVGMGEKITAGAGTEVSSTLRAENQRRYEEALADYSSTRDRWRSELRDLLDIPEDERTKKQVERIAKLREKLAKQKRPVKADYGAMPLALGGILKQPTFVAGEAGKEAVIPLESGSAMRILRDAVGGGGGSTQVINLTVNAGLGTNPDELGRVIVDVLKRYERRNSKVFEAPLVRAAADAGGVTTTVSTGGTFNRVVPARGG